MTRIDALFAGVRRQDHQSFIEWMGSVELPIRLNLARFARAVDVESIVQETLLRMWILAGDSDERLTGEDASLRFAIGIARNLARSEARRTGREHLLPPDDLPDLPIQPDPPPDPGLRQVIHDCIARLARKPKEALEMRLAQGAFSTDHEMAGLVGMTLNTFLQNIVRARKQMAECLERKGVRLVEVLR